MQLQPLENVTVLEMGNSLSEQLVGRHLRLLGASVITLSPPENNLSYILTSGKEIINDISEFKTKADVIITKTPKDIDPDTIYLSMPNFSSTDEEFKNVEDHEVNIMALSGIYIDMGIDRKLMGIPASYSHLPLASTYGSVFGALAVVVALNNGVGDVIEVPLASALMDTLVYNSMEYNCPDFYKSKRFRYSGTNLDYYQVQKLKDPFFSHYVCADGRPFYLVNPGHINHQLRTIKLLNIEKEVKELKIPIVHKTNYTKPTHGIGGGQIGDQWIKPLKYIMKLAFLTKPAFEWELLFGDNNIPSTPHRTTKEWIYSEHANQSGLITNQDGKIYPGPICWVQKDGDATQTAQSTQTAQTAKSPKSLNVLDLTNVIAGPTIGSILARFGANVTKIDMPNPIYSPEITIIFGMVANTNKKSILLDIIKGKEVIHKLIKKADMLIINTTNSGLDKLGLSPTILKEINPDIILIQFDAWGGPTMGRRSNHLGYDDNIQAGLGIMERFGGGLGRVEEHAHLGTIDVIAGITGALSAMSALYYKNHTNTNDVLIARASLAALGQLIQFPFICSNPEVIKSGPECIGKDELFSFYETLDNKWVILVGKSKNELVALDERFGNENQSFVDIFKQETAETWKNKLNIQILISIEELRSKYKNGGDTYQFSIYPNHPIGGSVTTFAPCSIRSKHIRIDKQPPAPKYGEHTIEILKTLNVDIESLLKDNIISTQWSDQYLPI
jgi:crotonobetainyl-CoA:carnitine CoA-transferase CaiB-like acyl-CoA transferase